MQAYPQSTLAARAPSPISLSHDLGSVAVQSRSLSETTGLAHDAGNLLAGLTLYSDLLARPGVLRPEHSHYATELRLMADRSARLLERLVEQLLHPPVIKSQPAALFLTPARPGRSTLHEDPAATLERLAPLLHCLAAPVPVIVRIVHPCKASFVLASEAIERIVVNLVRNAAHAITDAGITEGEVHVTLDSSDGRLLLQVEDNGPGLSAAQAAAFLHPQLPPPQSTHGLGHRIVHDLAAQTGASLAVRSLPGSGTTFSLEWPVAETSTSAVRTAPTSSRRPNHGATKAC